MQLSKPTLEPHSLCYACWVQVVYSLLPTLHFFLLFSLGTPYCCSVPGDAEEFTQSYQEYKDFKAFVSQSTSLWRPASETFLYMYLRFRCIRHFVIHVINNIRTRFIISFYVICAVIYCSFCCIYVWLDPGTYMIARFMSFYKLGVTEWYQSYIDCRTKA